MKRLFIISVLMLSGCASQFGHNWSIEDSARQIVFTGLLAYDVQVQTPKYINEGRENNGLIEKVGSDNYFWLCAGGHAAVSAMLKPQYRKWWQYFWIGAEGATIMWNWSVD